MARRKDCLKLFQKCFILNFILYVSGRTTTPSTAVKVFTGYRNDTNRIPIGVVFDQNTNTVQNAFRLAMAQHANINSPYYLNFHVYVDVINTADCFKLSRLVCNQFGRGVVSMLVAVHMHSFATFHSYANTFHMPFVTPFFPEKVLPPNSRYPDFAMSILPDYHKAVLRTVAYYNWKDVIYLYDSEDGLLRLQELYKSLIPGMTSYFRIANVKKIDNGKDAITFLRQLEKVDRWSNKYIILDCSTAVAKETIISHVHDLQLGRRNYHYLFSGLVLDERWDMDVGEYSTINMTGFRLVDTSRKFVKDFFNTFKLDSIPAEGALMYDTLHTTVEAFQQILKYKPYIIENLMNKTNKYRFLNCDTQEPIPLKYGDEIADFMRKTQVEGLSGKIRFSSSGVRKNFSLVVVRNTPDGNLIKIGTWYDDKGFRPVRKVNGLDSGKYDRTKTYTVVSIEEPPYFMTSKLQSEFHEGSEVVYRGFCAELAELIAEKLQIKIQFRLSADGKFGEANPNMIGGWDGMIGELVRKEADMVVAPLIVTAWRETVVDFSKPFLSFNRMAPITMKEESVTIFGFLKPLAKETWYLLGGSVILVSIVMFLVSCLSPTERRVVAVTDTAQSQDGDEAPVTESQETNEFGFFNSLWYALGAFFQQGSASVPRALAGRIVSTVWWFFALIVTCSYTAYLASQLTLNGMESPMLPVYNRLAHCPEDIQAGIKKDIIVDGEIYGNAEPLVTSFMSKPKDYVNPPTRCEMLVTVLDPGILDFAVAFPRGSDLRTGVNLALIAIREEGEMNRLIRKYFHNSDCRMPLLTRGPVTLTLTEIVGLFYILLSAMALGLLIAIVEFCTYYHSNAAKDDITVKATIRGESLVPVDEAQEPQSTTRRQCQDEEREWNETGTAPGSYAGSRTEPGGSDNASTCECHMKTSPEQVVDNLHLRRRVRQANLSPLLDSREQIDETIIRRPRKQQKVVRFDSLNVPFESPSRRSPMRAVRNRHMMSRRRSQQGLQQETFDAIEMTSRPYFTPGNQTDQEETALQHSLTQV